MAALHHLLNSVFSHCQGQPPPQGVSTLGTLGDIFAAFVIVRWPVAGHKPYWPVIGHETAGAANGRPEDCVMTRAEAADKVPKRCAMTGSPCPAMMGVLGAAVFVNLTGWTYWMVFRLLYSIIDGCYQTPLEKLNNGQEC